MEIKTSEKDKQNLELLILAAEKAANMLDHLAKLDKRHGAFTAGFELRQALDIVTRK